MSNFGQLLSVIDLANQVGYHATQAVIKSEQAKGEYKLGKKKLDYEQIAAQEEAKLREKELALRVAASSRQDVLFKDIAIVVGIGLTLTVAIITGGVLLSSKKSKI